MACLRSETYLLIFRPPVDLFRAVDSVDIVCERGEILSIVGESGSGKSVSMLALMGLLPWTAKVTAEKMEFDGRNLLGLSKSERRKIIGKDMAMIFQEPMSSAQSVFYGWISIGRNPANPSGNEPIRAP